MWAVFELLIKTLTSEVALVVLNLFSFPEPRRENDFKKRQLPRMTASCLKNCIMHL